MELLYIDRKTGLFHGHRVRGAILNDGRKYWERERERERKVGTGNENSSLTDPRELITSLGLSLSFFLYFYFFFLYRFIIRLYLFFPLPSPLNNINSSNNSDVSFLEKKEKILGSIIDNVSENLFLFKLLLIGALFFFLN